MVESVSSPSLKACELTFQSLQHHLSHNISHRLSTRLIGNFCSLLLKRDNPVLNHSYYQEILEPLTTFLSDESLQYQPLSVLQSLLDTLAYINANDVFATTGESFQSVFRLTQRQTVASLLNVGETICAIETAIGDSPIDPVYSRFDSLVDLELIHDELVNQEFPQHILDLFSRIRKDSQTQIEAFSNQEVWIPLVEKYTDNAGHTIIVGTLYPLRLDMEARKTARDKDLIFFNNHPLAQDDLLNYQAQDAITAARRCHKVLGKSNTTRFSVSFGFTEDEYFFSGSSFGLGMSLLSLCALEKETNLRSQHSISQNTAFTGGVDLIGNIRSVNPDGLAEKVKTTFFSPLSTMVIPQENLEMGQRILDDLQLEYPKKTFTLIPQRTLASTLENKNQVINLRLPLIFWARNHFKGIHLLGYVLVILLFTPLLGLLLYFLNDKNPSTFKVEGEKLLLYNKSGGFLWEHNLGHTPTYLENHESKIQLYRRLIIQDIDGDGMNEVMLGTALKNYEHSGQVRVFEPGGKLRWSYLKHPSLSFNGHIYSGNYSVGFIYPFKQVNAKTLDIYVRFSHMPYYPNRLVRFDVNGEQMDEFIHPGTIYDLEMLDLNSDGKMEIVLGCTNNGFNSGAVAIMPSRNFSGTVPSLENHHALDGGEVDSNLVYMRFPAWGKYDFSGSNARSHVSDVFPNQDNGFIVTVNGGAGGKTGAYIYHFDYDLNILALTVSDGFLSQYHRINGRPFFDDFDQDEWYETMTNIDIWRQGQWSSQVEAAK